MLAVILACTVMTTFAECGPECAALRPEMEKASSVSEFAALTERVNKAPGADFVFHDRMYAWAQGHDERIAALVATRDPALAGAGIHARNEEDHTLSTPAMITLLADRTGDPYTRWSAAYNLGEDQPVNACFVEIARQVASDASDPAAETIADVVASHLSDEELRAADRGPLAKVALLERVRRGDRTVSEGIAALMLDTTERIAIRERAIDAAGELGATAPLERMLDERYWFDPPPGCYATHSVQQVANALYHAHDPRLLALLEQLPLEKLPEAARAGIERTISGIRLLARWRQQAH